MQNILSLSRTNKLILAAVAFLAVLAFGGGRADAATITVGSGCTISNAIASHNAGSDQASCGGTAYGTNDTINIPAGTYVLPSNLPNIQGAVTIKGDGMGQTIIDGGSSTGSVFLFVGSAFTLSDMSITNYEGLAVNVSVNSPSPVTLQNLEVDGIVDAGFSPIGAIFIDIPGNGGVLNINNVYMHDYEINRVISSDFAAMISVNHNGGGSLTADIENITIANIDSDVGAFSTYGIIFFTSSGTINGTVTNATIDNFVSQGFTAPFFASVEADGNSAATHVVVRSATITGLRGHTGTRNDTNGASSAAFYALGSAYGNSDVGSATIDVQNSLFADNLNDGVPNNCATLDRTSAIGGSGTSTVAIRSLGHNISDDDSCTSFSEEGDQQNVSNIISTLGQLQDNGGPLLTRALLDGSPAISAGGAVLGVTTDARGVARPSTCPSVGAYQFEGAVCAATTTNANAGGTAAPNTGVNTASNLITFIVSTVGVGLVIYALRRRITIK